VTLGLEEILVISW